MKRLRRVFAVLCILGLLLTTAGLYVWYRIRETPDWYRPFALDEATQRKAANDLIQDLIETFGKARAAQIRQRQSDNAAAAGPISIALSEDEMNSWAATWDVRFHWKTWMANRLNLHDGVVIMQDHQFILAAKSKQWETVVSIHFEPRMENGKLNLHLSRAMAGTMPIPRWIWSRFVSKGSSVMEQALPAQRREAEINPRGWANSPASDAAMSELTLHMLRDEPAEPVLFLPDPETLGKGGRSLVMQISSVDIASRTLTVQMEPMNADQREGYFQRLKGAEQSVGMGK
jgi:hypothetical protein